MNKQQPGPLLSTDDWRRVNDAIDAVIDEKRPKRTLASRIRAALRKAEATGDKQADRIINAMADDGLLKVIHQRNRLDSGVFRSSSTGKVLNVPARASAPTRDKSGARIGLSQLRLWHEMTWDEFDAWAITQLHLASSMQFKARGIARIRTLRAKYPDTRTPGEACKLDGIDVRSIDIDLAA